MSYQTPARLSLILLSLASLARGGEPAAPLLLRAARVFDGVTMRTGWDVVVSGGSITAAGSRGSVAAGNARVLDLPGTTPCCPD